MARNVGVNSTFEQQRLVINELAVDVETLENAGYITGYTEQDNLGTVLARGNQATSDILLTGIITATSFVGDGSNLTGISAGAGGTDNVSTSTLTVAGVSTFTGRIVGSATTNIIPFLYANLSDLPSASNYHGAFAHVHATGKAYYAHSGAWVELVNAGTDGTVGTGTENYNVGVITGTTINATQFVGDGSGLTGVVAQGTGIVIQEEGSSVGTAGTINFIGAGVTATLAGGIASVEITTSGSTYTDSDVDTHLNTGTASNNEVLSWTGSDYDWVAQSGGGLSNVLEDTTPQLGGNLDINNKYIIGTGGANITGVVTATRFESTSAGTPTIDSPNNLNINAVTVAISTNLTAGGSITATQFVGDGSGLTGVVAQGTGIVIQEEGSSVGTAGTINFIGAGVTATLSNGIASVEITSSGGGGGISNVVEDTTPQLGGDLDVNSNDITGTGNINLTGVVTTTALKGFEYLQAPHGTSVNIDIKVITKTAAHRYNGTGSSSGYTLNGVESPFLILTPGRTYNFKQDDISNLGHPFRFYLEADKTTQYTEGVTTLGIPGNAFSVTSIEVTDETPVVLHYQCSAHGYMGNAVQVNSNKVNTPYLITGLDGANITGVVTATTFDGPLKGLPQNAQTSAYVLVAGDAGKNVAITTGGVTVNTGVFDVGDTVSIYNDSEYTQMITAGGGVTLRRVSIGDTGDRGLNQYGLATIMCIRNNEFVISGAGLT